VEHSSVQIICQGMAELCYIQFRYRDLRGMGGWYGGKIAEVDSQKMMPDGL
jgi:hypothetical protein